MNEVIYRSIFPDNNIPKIKVTYKEPNLEEKLSVAVNSLIDYADFSKIFGIAKEIEFREKLEHNPVEALLQKLKEISG